MANISKMVAALHKDAEARWARGMWASETYLSLYRGEVLLQHSPSGWKIWVPTQLDILTADWVEYVPLAKRQPELDLQQPKPVPVSEAERQKHVDRVRTALETGTDPEGEAVS